MAVVNETPPVAGTENWDTPLNTFLNAIKDAVNELTQSVDPNSYEVITGSTLSAALLSIDGALLRARSTGAFVGGAISVDGGTGVGTTISVTDGQGGILDLSDPENPNYHSVTWTDKVAVVPSSLSGFIYWYIDQNGNLQQTTTPPTTEQWRTRIWLGYTAGNGSALIAVAPVNTPISNTAAALKDLTRALGAIRVSGSAPSAAGANLTFQVSAGEMFDHGATRWTAPNAPNTPMPPSFNTASGSTFSYLLSAPGGLTGQTNVDVGYYQVAGVRTAASPTTRITVHYVMGFPSGNTYLIYDDAIYTSLDAAEASLSARHVYQDLVASTITRQNSFILGAILTTANNTNLSNTANARFIVSDNQGKF